jgi:hypothetical protein
VSDRLKTWGDNQVFVMDRYWTIWQLKMHITLFVCVGTQYNNSNVKTVSELHVILVMNRNEFHEWINLILINFNKTIEKNIWRILVKCLKISSLCARGLKTGIKTRFTEPFSSFAPDTYKLYILRYCINFVFILQKNTLNHRLT